MNFAKWIAPVMVVSGVVVFGAEPAAAGGTHWNVTADHYEVGDTAFAWAQVGWEHNPALGTPEDGPYRAYLVPYDPQQSMTTIAPPPNAVEVAELNISLEPYGTGGVRFGPHHATIEFVVPDVPDGLYTIGHCNSPCTTLLGDLLSGALAVGPAPIPLPTSPPPSAPPTTSPTTSVSQPTVADVAPSARRAPAIEANTTPGGSGWTPYLVGAFVGVLAVTAGLTVARLRGRARVSAERR